MITSNWIAMGFFIMFLILLAIGVMWVIGSLIKDYIYFLRSHWLHFVIIMVTAFSISYYLYGRNS